MKQNRYLFANYFLLIGFSIALSFVPEIPAMESQNIKPFAKEEVSSSPDQADSDEENEQAPKPSATLGIVVNPFHLTEDPDGIGVAIDHDDLEILTSLTDLTELAERSLKSASTKDITLTDGETKEPASVSLTPPATIKEQISRMLGKLQVSIDRNKRHLEEALHEKKELEEKTQKLDTSFKETTQQLRKINEEKEKLTAENLEMIKIIEGLQASLKQFTEQLSKVREEKKDFQNSINTLKRQKTFFKRGALTIVSLLLALAAGVIITDMLRIRFDIETVGPLSTNQISLASIITLFWLFYGIGDRVFQ